MTILMQLKELEIQENKLKEQLSEDIKILCKKYDGALDEINYYDNAEVWIYLNKGVCINTNLFKELDSYFEQTGSLSYSTGDGFVVVYRFREVKE